MQRGLFIVLEGPDGSGKSTQAALLAEALRGRGHAVKSLRDPGGTEVGDRIREILLGPAEIEPDAELFLFLASRAQMVGERVLPALEAGRIVVCDRFTPSTVVYQGHASERVGRGGVDALRALVDRAAGGVRPDLLLFLDVDPGEGIGRKGSGGGGPPLDRIESRGPDYHLRVREGYLEEARRREGARVIPPGTVEETRARVLEAAEALLAGR